jgi:hypothetical protein
MSIPGEALLVQSGGRRRRTKGNRAKRRGTKRGGQSALVPLGLLGTLLAMGPKHHRKSKKRTRRRRRGRR